MEQLNSETTTIAHRTLGCCGGCAPRAVDGTVRISFAEHCRPCECASVGETASQDAKNTCACSGACGGCGGAYDASGWNAGPGEYSFEERWTCDGCGEEQVYSQVLCPECDRTLLLAAKAFVATLAVLVLGEIIRHALRKR